MRLRRRHRPLIIEEDDVNSDIIAPALFALSALIMGIGALMKSRTGQSAASEISLTCLFVCVAILYLPDGKTTSPNVAAPTAGRSTARN